METDPDVSSFDHKITTIEGRLNFFLKQQNKLMNSINFNNFKNDTSGIEYSIFCSTLSFVLCSLHHVQLKLEGGNMSTHPISTYLNRIKSYMKQINDLQNKDSENRPTVNKLAVSRIIKSSTL